MERKKFTFRPQKNMFVEMQEQAEKDGISLNSWMNMTLKRFMEKNKNDK